MTPEAGVSLALARARAAVVSDVRCAIRFDIPSDCLAPIHADVGLTFGLESVDGPLVLDFAPDARGRIVSWTVNGEPMVGMPIDGHLIVPEYLLRPGENTVLVECIAGDAPLNRRDDLVYTIFVPSRAHEVFPCFDQPDLKARWTLTLTIPGDWTAVANADIGTRRGLTGVDGSQRTIVEFEETEPLPTYLFAFAAGRFVEDTALRDGRRIRLYHCGIEPELWARNRGAILDSHAEALRWLESYTDIPYPFSKFDIVLLPAFQFSGMEHPGAIFYSAAALLIDGIATRQQLMARADLIAHETSHIWFGDLWTMRWFDDVWLKEALANYMAARIVHPHFPDLDHDLRFFQTHYPAAYDVDRTAGTHAIRQPLANLNDASTLYGPIIYLKSPIVMRQLAMQIGEMELRDGLNELLTRYRFANASWPDLLDLLASRTAVDLYAWSRAWIDGTGRPTIRAELTQGDGLARLDLHSTPMPTTEFGLVPPVQQKWPQRLEVALGYDRTVEHVAMSVDGRSDVITIVGYPPPSWVLPNGRGIGYGEFRLDRGSLTWLLEHLPEIPDALTRAAAWMTLWDAMLLKDVDPEAVLALALRAIPAESSEMNQQRILVWLDRLFWIFLSAGQRELNGQWLDDALRSAVTAAPSPSQKAAIFACLRAVATTESTVQWMRALWRGDTQIDGFPFGENDRLALVKELAVRDADGDVLVQEQMARTRSRDGREALGFIAPALSADEQVRDGFFALLADAGNRRREPWVVEGMRWLHHPLRAESSTRYIEPGLELLEQVRQTSDIFLPKRWLDAMLSGHSSMKAALRVQRFLDSRPPDYPPALRRMVLASADHLFRASFRRSVVASH